MRSYLGAASLFAFVSLAPGADGQEPAAGVAKTTFLGKMPVKFNLGVEYSVVSQDAYGEQGKLVLEVIPVIPNLIRRPILCGG